MINVFNIKKGLIKTNKNHIIPFYKKSKLTKKSLKVKIFRVYLETLKSVPDDSILHYLHYMHTYDRHLDVYSILLPPQVNT